MGGPADGQNQSARGAYLVRRITPKEAERLQGFDDNWTRIRTRKYQRKTVTKLRTEDRWTQDPDGRWWLMAADGPRYKAIGNSMAVNVMSWIGRRIDGALALEMAENA